MLAQGAGQDLPLLPGEFEFLSSRGWDRQFQDFTRHLTPYDFSGGTIYMDIISSRRVGCACDHATRTAVCRLYPLLPVFDLDGRVIGSEVIGMYEELERLEGMAPACQISSLPFEQLNIFLRVCEILATSPVFLFHLAAYRALKKHAFERLSRQKAETGKSAFTLFESAFLRRQLLDHVQFKAEIAELKNAFEMRYGSQFAEEMDQLQNRP
jgi:hypothetical protein